MNFKSQMINSPSMVTKQQEYLSSIFKTFGFGFVAPAGSILFQWFVFKKSPYFGHFLFAAIVFFLGIIVMYIGYRFLKEKTK